MNKSSFGERLKALGWICFLFAFVIGLVGFMENAFYLIYAVGIFILGVAILAQGEVILLLTEIRDGAKRKQKMPFDIEENDRYND